MKNGLDSEPQNIDVKLISLIYRNTMVRKSQHFLKTRIEYTLSVNFDKLTIFLFGRFEPVSRI